MTNKQNRQSKVGHNVHSGGSISARVHRKKMVSDSFCLNYNMLFYYYEYIKEMDKRIFKFICLY